mmetsp:Transcript_39401/g.104626  ORF Transcript_39401/g.104626 Transcript_39401/m.104626 type:complete len:312 (-) Transcript_39401:8-943(-)
MRCVQRLRILFRVRVNPRRQYRDILVPVIPGEHRQIPKIHVIGPLDPISSNCPCRPPNLPLPQFLNLLVNSLQLPLHLSIHRAPSLKVCLWKEFSVVTTDLPFFVMMMKLESLKLWKRMFPRAKSHTHTSQWSRKKSARNHEIIQILSVQWIFQLSQTRNTRPSPISPATNQIIADQMATSQISPLPSTPRLLLIGQLYPTKLRSPSPSRATGSRIWTARIQTTAGPPSAPPGSSTPPRSAVRSGGAWSAAAACSTPLPLCLRCPTRRTLRACPSPSRPRWSDPTRSARSRRRASSPRSSRRRRRCACGAA